MYLIFPLSEQKTIWTTQQVVRHRCNKIDEGLPRESRFSRFFIVRSRTILDMDTSNQEQSSASDPDIQGLYSIHLN